MAWIRVDDKFTHGPKVTRAAVELGGGRKARGRVLAVWLDMVSYCNLNLTDGFVPAYAVEQMADAKPREVLTAMAHSDERLGPLVEAVEGGWQMRNYADYQPTRAEIEAARKRTADRQKAWRERKSNSVTPRRVDVASQPTEPDRPEPNRTEPDRTEEQEPLAPVAEIAAALEMAPHDQAPRPQRAPYYAKRSPSIFAGGSHPRCAPETFGACARGICVKHWDVAAWRGQIGPEKAYDYIREFVDGVLANCPDGVPIGDPAEKFWPAQWQAKHGSSVPREPRSNGERTVDAANRLVARYEREGRL